jgi:uncharacterized protein YcaQ
MVSGIEGTIAFFAKHQCVQVDPIDVAGRNADLTLQSRVDGYRQEYLVNLLYKERRLFEYYCKMLSIMPIHLYPIFKHQMAAYSVEKRVRTFFKKYRAETKHILKALEKGPVSSRDIVDMGTMKSGWGHNANVSNMILARLWISGRAIIHSREGAVRTYSIPQNVLPKKLLNAEPPNKKEALVEIAKVIVKASRLVTPNGSLEQWYHVGNSKTVREILDRLEKDGEVFEVQLDGSKEKFYAPSSDMKEWGNHQEAEGDYVRFLAPLDPLLWSRKVFSTIYGRSYSWEVYKKPQDRKYGYYTMPVLFNGEYVGLIEPYFRKTDRVLEIRSFHTLGGEFNRHRFLSALREEVERFCGYLSAQRTEVRRSPPWVRDALTRAA